jgi:Tol biopolymer transport system component/DNA-binding winged helix-turn-helix (wHTH) protein
MGDAGRSRHVPRFGIFELDLQAGELRKNGLKIRLQDQPFKVLAALLERPGEVVEREELRRRLWPDDTFVDFDHGLASAINRLREALGDSAENPRFVETLPRHGYRFIAPVDGHPGPAEAVADLRLPTRRTRKAILAYGIALAVVTGLAVLAFLFRLPLPPPRVLSYTQITHDGLPKVFGPVTGPLVTDGLRLFFSGPYPDGGLFSVTATGGETIPIPTTFREPYLTDISPDGAQLVICHSSGCDISPVLGGAPRHLGDTVEQAWFADEHTLICATGKDISLVKVDGSDSRKVVSITGNRGPYWPKLSPDGSVIRFTVYDREKDTNSLWEVSSDGTNLHPLLPGWKPGPQECCGSWTPDGKYYLFQAGTYYASYSRSAGRTQIWAIRERPGFGRRADRTPVQVTNGPMDFFSPALSKDGKKIFAIGVLHRDEFVRYNPKSREFEPFLTKIPAGGWGMDLTKDGKRVVYRALSDLTLWRGKSDGTEQVQLTSSPLEVMLPRWSPDEKRIAFSARTPRKPWNAYVISAEGGTPQQVLPEAGNQMDVTWSPDGNSLAFGRIWEDVSVGKGGIHIVNLQTHQVRTLPNSGSMFSPRWSPDGRLITAEFVSRLNKPLQLFDLDRGKWVELDGANGGDAGWSPDSKYVYYVVIRDSAFYRVRVSDHKIEPVASYKGSRPAIMAPAGPWWGYAPGNIPCLLREVANEEIYALDWETP